MNQLPENRQTLCFSATMNKAVNEFSEECLDVPVYVKAPKKNRLRLRILLSMSLKPLDDENL